MKKQIRILKTITILLMLIMLLTPMVSFATDETGQTTIKIYTRTNTDVYNLGENVEVNVSWQGFKDNMTWLGDVQAIGFTLQYDETKLEFVEATCEDSNGEEKILGIDFYNVETPGTLILSTVSFDDVDIMSINLNFKTIDLGETVVQLIGVDCVADGNLVSPDIIDFTTNSTATIKTIAFGDVDLNGTVDIGDATYIGMYAEGTKELNNQEFENADVNLDGIVDNLDKELLQKSLAKNISLPIRYGDVNLDGRVELKDKFLLNSYLKGEEGIQLSEQAMIQADTNMDGILNKIDGKLIVLHIGGYNFGMPFKMFKNTNISVKDIESMHLVFGFDSDNVLVSKLLENFNTDNGVEVCNNKGEVLGSEDKFGTGTKVKLGGDGNKVQTEHPDGSEEYWAAEYNVVIYGDTTGDGKINAVDALALIKHLNDAIPFTSEVFAEAGSIVCEEGAEPTAVDALAIIKHANGKQLISQTK